MKNYNRSIESSYLTNLDVNNLYGWGMSPKLPVNGSKWVKNLSKFDERFIKDYDENSNKEYILEAVIKYQKNLFNLLSDLQFLPERIKIKKCNKLVCNNHDKENYVVHMRSLKQALNHGSILKKYTD